MSAQTSADLACQQVHSNDRPFSTADDIARCLFGLAFRIIFRTRNTRLVPGASERILNTLQWAGIGPDEGPYLGGDYGPYVQSHRIELYQKHAHMLLETGAAYKCFCTDTRLQLIRKDALRNRQIPKYDNRCRHLPPRSTENSEEPYVIRLKLTDGDMTFHDGIHGPVTLNISETEGDPIILKSDGFPTYHLACVVDDHLMDITHVLRGVEWQVSTPKHLMLYNAFGWTAPKFLHLPLMLNKDGTKLSKRQGDISISKIREEGYSPTTLLNFLILAGGGFGKQTGEEFYPLPQIVEKFCPDELNPNSCQLDMDRLPQCSRLELHSRLRSASSCEDIVDELRDKLREKYGNRLPSDVLSETYLLRVIQESKDRINCVKDLLHDSLEYIWLDPEDAYSDESYDDCRTATRELCDKLQLLEQDVLHRDVVTTLTRQTSRELHIKHARFMQFLRLLLSGLKEGPGVGEMMSILGKKITLDRLSKGLPKSDTSKGSVATHR
ncbi:nondiscriminating glutamyl-tRNA synthetase EARS2, mitochondrial-like isoform X2 [Ornithodoros turicata]|uniref:nondiscriminating glutamyl-tRNA synthetase EARS2, mitochondrial-like isoform X2 n=1 Tax=Ornithodoros turicata TaxID=34597 RepID=UPI0031386766